MKQKSEKIAAEISPGPSKLRVSYDSLIMPVTIYTIVREYSQFKTELKYFGIHKWKPDSNKLPYSLPSQGDKFAKNRFSHSLWMLSENNLFLDV